MVSVLVIDPRPRFRDRLAVSLGNWFTVHTAGPVAEAVAVWARERPEAALASMVQAGEATGLELLGRLRRTSRGRDVIYIGYGRARGSATSAEAIDAACREYGLATWIVDANTPDDLQSQLLGQLLKLRTFDTAGRLPPLSGRRAPLALDPPPVLSARNPRPSSAQRIRAIATHEIGLVDKTWTKDEPTWGQLLRSRASTKNLRRMVRKAMTGLANDSAARLNDTGS
jgi:CheY-like chemotaxis protein